MTNALPSTLAINVPGRVLPLLVIHANDRLLQIGFGPGARVSEGFSELRLESKRMRPAPMLVR